MRSAAARSARISAWAVGSLRTIGALLPRPMISPSSNTTAPTGTSPPVPPARARVNASRIYLSSTIALDAYNREIFMAELEIHHEGGHSADPAGKRVGVQAAIVAVLLAVVTILSHRSHT